MFREETPGNRRPGRSRLLRAPPAPRCRPAEPVRRAGHGGGRSGGGGGAAGAVGAPAVEKRCAMVGESRAYDHRGIAEKPPLAFEEGAFPFGELWGFEFRPRGACRAYLVRNGLLNAVGVRGCRAQVASSQLASPESEVLSSELS